MYHIEFSGREYRPEADPDPRFLWQGHNEHEKLYIMGNHRCAFWCWMRHISSVNRISLLHIDRHFDALDFPIKFWGPNLSANLSAITLKKYLELSYQDNFGETRPLFDYDNYITIFIELFKESIESTIFATHNIGDEPKCEMYELDLQMLKELPRYIDPTPQAKWIVNLDLDYFFEPNDDHDYIRTVEDQDIRVIAKNIKDFWNDILVLTIAMSPEFCETWEASESALRVFLEELNVSFSLPPD